MTYPVIGRTIIVQGAVAMEDPPIPITSHILCFCGSPYRFLTPCLPTPGNVFVILCFFVLGNPPTPSPTHNVFLSFCWWFLVKYCVTSNTNSPGITISWWPRLQLIRFCLKRIRDQNEFEELLLKMSNTNNLVYYLVYYSIYTIDGEPHIYFGTVTWSSISTYLHLFIYLLGC